MAKQIFKTKKTRNKVKALKQPPERSTRSNTVDLLRRLQQIEAFRESLKPLYAEEDAIIQELCRRDDVAMHGAVIKDNFMGKNSAWKSVNFKRYVVEWER